MICRGPAFAGDGLITVQFDPRLGEEVRVERPMRHLQQALVAMKGDFLPVLHPHRRHRDIGCPAQGALDHRIHLCPDIDAILADHPAGKIARLAPRHEPGRSIGVDADIANAAAAGFRPVADVLQFVGIVVAEKGVHMQQLADRAALHQFARALPLRMVDDHVGLGREKPGPVAFSDEDVDLVGRHRDRLLGQDMLARRQHLQRPFHMHVIGQRNVDRVDRRIGEKILIAHLLQAGAEIPPLRGSGV